MRNIIVATKNKGKYHEIKEILTDMPFNVLSMEDMNLDIDIVENGNTFEENSLIKAREVCKLTGDIVIADDSGLEIDYLNGRPGIHSSRFGGENTTDEERNRKLLTILEKVPFEKRKARFVCVIAVVYPEGNYFTVKGTCDGYIDFEPKGKNGFGYDPIFYVPEYDMTTAQMEPKEKHKISHRGKALKLMIEELKRNNIFN
ncbi:MAG TPA: XTP/dITP diphosphatase [Clostridiaceae bacterium]|jgi:XTP/dITP diphosphohydrolase|nr:XTP/dITP diphosphatase [Clostridiaceae bacterium]